jgi:hypothetical protein
MIVPTDLLSTLRKLLPTLEAGIRERAEAEPAVGAGLRAEHAEARRRGRTAAAFEPWRDEQVTQAAVAWVLGCVFVRFAEDNGLVDEPRLAGAGERLRRARDAQTAYFQAHPHESDRHYLLDTFRQTAALPGMGRLFDEAHNPLFRLGLAADGASDLLAFWRAQHDDGRLVHDFTDPGLSTRFLGDLYQDISEAARKRFALLQTPEFVEEFILDRTLDPALDTFGLAETHLIDPTCGSGHFLLGAFARLLDTWRRAEPGTDVRQLAQWALDQVAGVDVNPFAVAIAHFRLLVAALSACGLRRLADAPDFAVHVTTGDSLLRDPQLRLDGIGGDGDTVTTYTYATEDAEALDRIFGRRYEAVVGNPPYITVKDRALRDAYRQRYAACYGEYGMAVPFTERFFGLARPGASGSPSGFVGTIITNNFMKRQSGKKLIEDFLPTKDLTTIVDMLGVAVPGHGTPTVMLFGRNQWPSAPTVRVVQNIRGEASPPEDPAKGMVWRAILDQIDLPGSESPYIGVDEIARTRLATHPWSIGGGGAAELKERIDSSGGLFRSVIESQGFVGMTHADDVMTAPLGAFARSNVEAPIVKPLVVGDVVRDWSAVPEEEVLLPYGESGLLHVDALPGLRRLLWPFRTSLANRAVFGGGTYASAGRTWWEWHQLSPDRLAAPRLVTVAFVATCNHFVLVRGGRVFKQSAPVIKLPDGASEDDHLRLLGLLNSSVACFWMQQVFHNKGAGGGKRVEAGYSAMGEEAWMSHFEFDSTKLQRFPVVDGEVLELARRLDNMAQTLQAVTPQAVCAREVPTRAALDEARTAWHGARAVQIALQEELDWRCLHLYGVTDDDLSLPDDQLPPTVELGQRAFEILLARKIAAGDEESVWFERHRSTPVTEVPAHWPAEYRELVERRIAAIESDRDVALVERPENKRRWATDPWEAREKAALRGWLLDRLEARDRWFTPAGDPRPQSIAQLTDALRRDADVMDVIALYGGGADPAGVVRDLVLSDAVPAIAAARYTPDGLGTRAVWERVWDLQRREDAGEDVGPVEVPPKYKQKDFRSTVYWQARGKLDVPKERFILYPGAERDVDPTAVVGWAGWDHLEQAKAVATTVIERRDNDAWDGERLMPPLAAWDEVMPWVIQWHNDPDPDTGLRLGDFFADQLATRCAELSLTRDDLRRWAPAAKRGRRRRAAPAPE